jgi:hypothetical protein
MPTNEIDSYVTYFRGVLTAIKGLTASADPTMETFFQKILYCCCLDSWTGDAFPGLGNKERFIKFIADISEWELRDRVSAFQLHLTLDEEGLRGSPLWEHVAAHFAHLWDSGKVTSTSYDSDPTFAELAKHARTGKERDFIRENRYDHPYIITEIVLSKNFLFLAKDLSLSRRTIHITLIYYLKAVGEMKVATRIEASARS